MKTKAGLWIDHEKAIVVFLTDKGEETACILSNVKKQLRRTGDSALKGPYQPELVPADDNRQKALTGRLNKYYDEVIAQISNAESILVFGPGEAKGELEDRLKKSKLGGRISGVETADKMTDRQIATKVRQYFLK